MCTTSFLGLGLTGCFISSRLHLLVWLLSLSCRLFLFLHFDVTASVGLRLCASLAVGFLLILLSLAFLAFFLSLLLLFLLWLRRWCGQDCLDFRLQRIDLVFYLFNGVREVFVLRLLQSHIDLNEVAIHQRYFVNDALLLFVSQLSRTTSCCFSKFGLDFLSLKLLEEVNPLANFVSKPAPSLDWVTNGTEGSVSLPVLFQRCLLTLTVDPVNGGLEVLYVGVPQSRVNVVLIIAIGL